MLTPRQVKNRLALIKDLRENPETHGRHSLYNSATEKFCCLGRAGLLLGIPLEEMANESMPCDIPGPDVPSIAKAFGFVDDEECMLDINDTYVERADSLASFNDSREFVIKAEDDTLILNEPVDFFDVAMVIELDTLMKLDAQRAKVKRAHAKRAKVN
jgi:hypothetical protein